MRTFRVEISLRYYPSTKYTTNKNITFNKIENLGATKISFNVVADSENEAFYTVCEFIDRLELPYISLQVAGGSVNEITE